MTTDLLATATQSPRNSRRETPLSSGVEVSFLASLHCPYCGLPLDVEAIRGSQQRVEYGVLRCGCHEYPVVEGISILQQVQGLDRVVGLIRRHEYKEALLRALNVFRITWAHRSRFHQARYYLNCRRLVDNSSSTFDAAASLVRQPRVFADYLVHRYANPSFLGAVGNLQLLKQIDRQRPTCSDSLSKPRILDLACGTGHSSFLIRRLYPGISLICADQDFVSLYLAHRFFVDDATLVCWDAEVPSPFADRSFNAVFCLDAFHYLKSKRAMVRELKRVLTHEALWIFSHLHNRLQHNIVAGVPLSPEGYLRCFDLSDARIFDETDLLRGLVRRRTLDLDRTCTSSELNSSPTLTLIRGGKDTWQEHKSWPTMLYGDGTDFRINPVYRVRWRDQHCDLELVWPNKIFENECRGVEEVLPRVCRLHATELAQLNVNSLPVDCERLNDLTARFVLVPLPPAYQRSDPLARLRNDEQ